MVRIGVIGDYTPVFESHPAIASAIELAARSTGIKATVEWLPTHEVSDKMLEHYDALWASPGSPYSSMDGMLAGIRYAREHGCPMVAT